MMTISRRRLLGMISSLSIATSSRPAMAMTPDEAQDFIARLIDEALVIVKRDAIGGARDGAFLTLMRKRAALEAVGRFAMGLNWRQMTDAQRSRYLAAFEGYASRVYAARVGDYADQTIDITGAQDVGRKGVLVKSLFNSPGAQPIVVEWLVDDRSGEPLLVDIIAEGVSLSISQREQFASMVDARGGDIDLFIADLDKLGV
jgi:phospholipid transport system substrate-binding protein